MIKRIHSKDSGFALLFAVITTSILLLVSFVVADLAYKELILTSTGQQSQIAFYTADSGIECALYWDLKNPNNPGISAFATSTPGAVTCNSQTVVAGSETTLPSESITCNSQLITVGPNSIIGGPSSVQSGGCAVSIFSINFCSVGSSCSASGPCAVVVMTKNTNGTTEIDSRGYNTCDTSATRRYERGITTTY
jgi:Tfp pilus assembly protein PilX